MILITAVSATLILGLVTGYPHASPEHHGWKPMTRQDDQHVIKVVNTKYPATPPIGYIFDGKKKQITHAVKYAFAFATVDSRHLCVGVLEDGDHEKYGFQCFIAAKYDSERGEYEDGEYKAGELWMENMMKIGYQGLDSSSELENNDNMYS